MQQQIPTIHLVVGTPDEVNRWHIYAELDESIWKWTPVIRDTTRKGAKVKTGEAKLSARNPHRCVGRAAAWLSDQYHRGNDPEVEGGEPDS
ncbi:MAG: hypothetical protein M3Q71_12880 [Chloroflexota bacterium]|nr:hypothetical protein [Chloroflexota bacterium]